MALPVGVLAAHNIMPHRRRSTSSRKLMLVVVSRSVNSLVWALLFVAIFGPGALAGTLAIAFRSIGFVGKLFGEALEEAQPGPIEALTAAGAPWRSRAAVRLLAAGQAGVLVDRAVPLGHQRARIGGAGPGRRGRHRHGARHRDEPVPVGPGRDGAARDLRRWSIVAEIVVTQIRKRVL